MVARFVNYDLPSAPVATFYSINEIERMKITIDTAQSPVALLNELTQAVRFALGPNYYIEQAGNFTDEEENDPNVNMTGATAPSALAALTPVSSGVVAQLPAATTPATATGGVELDAEGHPYDVRIHSAGKSKIANQTWKLKKGVDKDLVVQINAQNKALLGASLPTAAPPASNVVQLPPLAGVAALPTLPPVVAALPDLPPVVPVAAADVEIVVSDYPTFAAFCAQQMLVKPTACKRELDKGLTHYGFVDAKGQADITALQHRPEAIMPLYQWLKPVLELCAAG